ncbi:transposase [Calothrix sp. NIES-4071]|nr:transposase [Calothrix sp. NIES-4071]BAZ57776.1 transposase [Calothrix sp. NIES-4105]
MSNPQKTKKTKKTASQIKKAANQVQRLLILSGLYLDVWFVIKIEAALKVETTIINPVVECSDIDIINVLIDSLYTVRANTYNVLGSSSFWNHGWMGTQNIVSAKHGKPETILVNGLPMPAKIFEWTVQDTAKNILMQQEAAKIKIISRICKRIPKHTGAELTKQQIAENYVADKQRKKAFDALKSFETIKTIPWLHRYFRMEYKRGRCNQNRQIVYQQQAYTCKRISRYFVKLEVQGLERGKRITLIVKSNRIIKGQIRLIRSENGSLEIHHLETLYNRDYCELINRQPEIGLDRGYTEVFYTSNNQALGTDFGAQLNKKTDRITNIGRNRSKLWSLAYVRYKNNPQKAQRIIENNLGNKTELRRRIKDDAYINTVVNTACKTATKQATTVHVESLIEQIRSNHKLSRRAKNRLEKWEKGTVKDRLTHWSLRNNTNLNWVNGAYTSQIDHRNGTLLGTRNGDNFTTYDRVVFHSDHNAAMNVLHRGLDTEITRFMKYTEVQAVLLRRTALFLSAMGLTLLDAINLGWLDVKHKKCQAFKEILHGL